MTAVFLLHSGPPGPALQQQICWPGPPKNTLMLQEPLQPGGPLRGETLKGVSIRARHQSALLAVDHGRPDFSRLSTGPSSLSET